MRCILKQSGLAAALLLIVLPAAAHHSRTRYDQGRSVTIEGVVTRYEWANPHVYLYVETQTDSGGLAVWELENGPTTLMRRRGWSTDSFVAGDRIIAQGNPAREASSMRILVDSVQKEGVTYAYNEGLAEALSSGGPSPVKADSLSGTWAVPLEPFVQQFSNPSSWPLTANGSEAVQHYDDTTMNPQIQCIARTAPWVMIFPAVHKIEVSDSLVSILSEYDTIERSIYMDIATHDGAAVTHQGHSIGRWEDDVLIVDTSHFGDHRNGNARGLSSGSRKHLVERFELDADGKSLTYRFELEDLEYLAAPVTGEMRWAYRPDLEFAPIACELDNARRFITDE